MTDNSWQSTRADAPGNALTHRAISPATSRDSAPSEPYHLHPASSLDLRLAANNIKICYPKIEPIAAQFSQIKDVFQVVLSEPMPFRRSLGICRTNPAIHVPPSTGNAAKPTALENAERTQPSRRNMFPTNQFSKTNPTPPTLDCDQRNAPPPSPRLLVMRYPLAIRIEV